MIDLVRPRFTRDEFDAIWQRQEADKAERREELRRLVAKSPAPLALDLRQALVRLFNLDARDILRSHKGYPLAKKRDSYCSSLAIMRGSLRSLLAMISNFEAEALARGSNLMDPLCAERLGEIVLDVQRELFNCTNAAVSLVDHSRRISEALSLQDYDRLRLEYFRNDGLHEFVVSLRVLLHHLHVVDVGWNMTADFRTGTKTASFVLSKDMLTRVGSESKNMTSKAKVYLARQRSSIDLRDMFADYSRRADLFHDWLSSELQSERIIALRDYDNIIREKMLFDTRMMYNAMLGNWLNCELPPDPHSHLSRFLSVDQLEAVYKLPRNSREQVSLVISYADREGAVDEYLQERIYELFRRSEKHPDGDLISRA